MGLLSEGSPLTWEETKEHADHVRKHGIEQFLRQYRKLQDRRKDVLYWGDEVEYQLVKFDHDNRRVRLALKAQEVLEKLRQMSDNSPSEARSGWNPEYGEFIMEGTPGEPYRGEVVACCSMVEVNMRRRRQEIQRSLCADEAPLTLVVFPRMGVGKFTEPAYDSKPESGISGSLFYPDEAINSAHPRFRTLTSNIRARRKGKVCINVPVYKDTKTPSPFTEDFSGLREVDGEAQRSAKRDHIYMDSMGFGMTLCCLQVTMQAADITEAKLLYDQLAAFCPIMLALSAASPIHRGFLSDIDTRWTVIAQSVDDRTGEELGLQPLKNDRYRINKSRFDSIDSYLSESHARYNDIHLAMDMGIYVTLIEGGVDKLLAAHLAHLFIRDPISLFREKIHQNDEEDTDHFENIQSTNWQTMRLKLPPAGSNIGWRVEFRPMDVQLTDFENAAYVVFVVLLTRVILSFRVNLIIPISKVDENMKTASTRDAAVRGQYYFRTDPLAESSHQDASECPSQCGASVQDEYRLMTCDEIINGNEEFVGLLALIDTYLDSVECDVETRCSVQQYLLLISKRASGELKTTARWIRDVVTAHPEYKQDSVVSEGIAYDLLVRCLKVSREEVEEPELLPCRHTLSRDTIPPAVKHVERFLDNNNPQLSRPYSTVTTALTEGVHTTTES